MTSHEGIPTLYSEIDMLDNKIDAKKTKKKKKKKEIALAPHTAPEGDVENNTMDTQDDDAGKRRERGVGIGKNERRQQHNDDMKPEGDGLESENTGYATTTSSLQATTRVLFSPHTRFPQCNFAVEPAAMYKQTGLLLAIGKRRERGVGIG